MEDVIAKNVKVEEKENKMYKIYEMKDELEKSIENLNKMISQHVLLFDVVAKAKKDELKSLLEALPKTVEEYKQQIVKLTTKLNVCKKLINMYENKITTTTDELIDIIFELIF